LIYAEVSFYIACRSFFSAKLQAQTCLLKVHVLTDDMSIATNIEQWKPHCDKDQPAYCYYNFDETNSSLGLIYNYAAF